MTRKEAREKVMQLVFQMEAQNQLCQEEAANLIGQIDDKSQKEYIEGVVNAVIDYHEEIDSFIEAHSKWKINRLPKVELAILRIAVAETKYCQVPKEVAINEAVELSKFFGDGSKYVNGILSKL